MPETARPPISVVPNAYREVDDPAGASEPRRDADSSAPLRLVYTGTLEYDRDTALLHLVRGMQEYMRRTGDRVELVVASEKDHVLRAARAEEPELASMIVLRGWVTRAEALELQRSAHILVLAQPDYFWDAVPAKLFEYMGRRLPVFSMVPEGSVTRIMRSRELGVHTASTDRGVLADLLEDLAGRVAESRHLPPPPHEFSEEGTMAKYAEILREVLSGERNAGTPRVERVPGGGT